MGAARCEACGKEFTGRTVLDRLITRVVDGQPQALHGECADATGAGGGAMPMPEAERARRMLNHIVAIVDSATGTIDTIALTRIYEIIERIRQDWPGRPPAADNWLSGMAEDAQKLFQTRDLSLEEVYERKRCVRDDVATIMKLSR